MTANPTKTRELSISRIRLRAFQLAGQVTEYQQLDQEQGTLATDLLETIVDELQTEGVMLRAVGFYELQLEAGENLYLLPEDILRLVGTAMYIPETESDPEQANSELVVEPITREKWQTISAKGALSPPSRYFQRVEGNTLELRLWPIPSDNGIVRFQAHRLLGDNDDANATPDLERQAAQFLIWELAHQISVAKSMPVSRCAYLASEAEKRRSRFKMFSAEQTGFEVSISHRTYWT